MQTTNRRPGKYVAIAGIAAFLLLLSLTLLIRGDRPTTEPLEQTWTAEALRHEGAVDPVLAPSEVIPGPAGTTPGRSDRLLPSERDPKAGNTPRLRKGPRIPKRDLQRPKLSLGKKPREAPAYSGNASDLDTAISTIDPAEIRRVVGENERDVKTCWEEEADGDRSKKIEVALSVKPSGEVASARVKNVLRSEASECIATKAKGWKFNAPGGRQRQEVVIPFVVVRAT
jgi:hypothetical protein